MVIKMKDYERKAYYHETDQMQIIHHANYVKWLEEARIDFMDQLGFSYFEMEKSNILSLVLQIELNYKNPVKFNDTVLIKIKVESYNGVKLELSYEIINKVTNVLCVSAKSKHCFISNGKVVSLKKLLPEFHEKMLSLI